MTQTPRPERRGKAAAQFAPGMSVRLKTDHDQTFTIAAPGDDGWWDTFLLPGVARWDQLLTESTGDFPTRRWRLVTDLEPVPTEPVKKVAAKNPPAKKVTPDATS